jgi:WD40 repeat protein
MSGHARRVVLIAITLGLLAGGERLTAGPGSEPAADVHGDPLPAGAMARLGTVRLRHGEVVNIVAFLPDGKTLLTVDGDGVVRQWDLSSSKLVKQFKAMADQPGMAMRMNRGIAIVGGAVMVFSGVGNNGMALSADGKTLAVNGMDGTLRLWDTTAGKELRKIDHNEINNGVGEICFSPDGKLLAVKGYDSTIRLIEVATGKKARQLGEAGKNLTFYGGNSGMCFSPDGKMLVSTCGENANGKQVWHVILHDPATGKELRRISNEDQNGMPYATRFTADSKTLLWGKWDGTIHVADPATGKVDRQIKSQGGASDFLVTPNGKSLLVRNQNTGLRLLEFATGKEVKNFERITQQQQMFWGGGSAGSLAVSADGKLVAMAGEDHTVRLFDLAAGKERELGGGHRSSVTRVTYAPDGKTVFTRGQDNTLRVWDAATGKEQRQIKLPQGAQHFALSPDGGLMVAATAGNNSTSLWDTTTNKELHKLDGAKEGVGFVAFSAYGKTVAVYGAADKGLSIWLYDAATGKQKLRIKTPPPTPDNNGNFQIPMTAAAGLCFSPDGRFIAMTIDYHKLGVWDTKTGKDLPPIQAPDRKVIEGAVFTPDSRCVALDLVGEDAPRLWEIASGKERRTYGKKPDAASGRSGGMGFGGVGGAFAGGAPMPFTRPAASITFSPNGRLLAFGRADNSISVWDVATGKQLGQLKGHQGIVETLAFAPDGQTLLSGSRDTTSLIWDVKEMAGAARPQTAEVNVETRWKELASDNAPAAFEAIHALAGAPNLALAFLKDHLHAAAVAEPERIQQLIGELDSEQFAVRKRASTELEKIGESAAPLLRKALENDPSAEARKRIDELLNKIDATMPRGEALRSLRAIEVLETIGTAEAKQLLQTLAKGTPDAAVTRAAQGALDRLGS